MQYAITFESKAEFDEAINTLNQAGLIDTVPQVSQSSRVAPMEEILVEEDQKRYQQQIANADTVSKAFDEARQHDVRTAIVIMKEYQMDKNEAKAINALNEITKK